MQLTNTEKELFAVLFACGEPIAMEKLVNGLSKTQLELEAAAISLDAQLECDGYPITVKRLENSFQLCTRPQFEAPIRQVLELKKSTALSQAAMEVLAVIAYNQPVSKAFVEQVRGVDSSSIVNSLVEKGLVEDAGRLDLPGRPLGFKTTENFLRCFGLSSLLELPDISTISVEQTADENTDSAIKE